MGISGISDYGSLFANYKVPEIPAADLEQLKRTEALSGSGQMVQESSPQIAEASQDIDLSIEETRPAVRESVNPAELSLTFNAGEDYGYIGKDSDIASLDMQKAISDMKKDQVLQQYQYFVGSAENLFRKSSSEDGLVFLKF